MCVTHLYFTAAIIILGAGMMLATLVFIAEHVFSLVLGYRGYSRTDLSAMLNKAKTHRIFLIDNFFL